MNTTKQDSARRESERRTAKTAPNYVGRLGVNPEKLDHGKYQYRYINDDPGRIQDMKNFDYDLVPNGGEKTDSTDLGNMISVAAGVNKDGSAKRAYLARKPREYFEQDQKAAQIALDQQLAELRRGNDRHGGSQSDYVPRDGIRIDA